MATEKKVLKNLTQGVTGSFARLNRQMCFANGYEKPRYFDRQGKAGVLGLQAWTDSSYTITGAASAGGSMTADLYFSCVAIPVDTIYPDSFGDYRRGTPTAASAGTLTSSVNKTVTFTVPLAHPQRSLNIYSGAELTGGSGAESNFAAWAAVANGRFAITIDGTARNVEVNFTGATSMANVAAKIQTAIRALTSKYESVTWSTDHFVIRSSLTGGTGTITVTSTYAGGTDISGAGASDWLDCDTGNGTVTNTALDYEADQVWFFCSQGQATAALAQTATKYYVGQASNISGANVVLTEDPSTLNDALELDNIQPPTFRRIIALQDRIWGIVGVTEARGTATWDSANTRFQGKTYGAFTISSIVDQGSGVWRISFSGSPDLSAVTTSMNLSISGNSSSGNNVSHAIVKTVSDSSDYIDIYNEDGVATGASGTATVYATYFADGFGGAKFRFDDDGVNQIYTVATVDVANQRFTIEESEYNGAKTAGTYYAFFMDTYDRTLWWSKVDDPNSYPTENSMQFEENLTALSSSGEYLVVFGRESIYIVNPRNPSEFRKTNAPIGTNSPMSVVPSENGVYFYDGKTIRLFDGLQANDITRRRVADILSNVTDGLEHNVYGIYIPNEQSIRWYIPVNSSVVNNYYVQYNLTTGFWWIGHCGDVTCASVLLDETDGSVELYTASSSRHSGAGRIRKHDGSSELDGTDAGTTYYFGTVQSVDTVNRIIGFSIATGTVSTDEVGTPFTVFATGGVRDINGVISSITDDGGGNYSIGYHADFDFSTAQAGDNITIGIIPFIWGIKWDDFGSPQYKHELKEVHIHFTPTAYLYGIVDFYTDYSSTPNKSVSFTVTNDSKSVIRYHGERGYQIGHRIRIWSYDQVEIRDIVLMHRTIV